MSQPQDAFLLCLAFDSSALSGFLGAEEAEICVLPPKQSSPFRILKNRSFKPLEASMTYSETLYLFLAYLLP